MILKLPTAIFLWELFAVAVYFINFAEKNKKTGEQVVVLIDEHDSPLITVLHVPHRLFPNTEVKVGLLHSLKHYKTTN